MSTAPPDPASSSATASAKLVAELGEKSRTEVVAWLRSALRGQVALPYHGPGELPYLAIVQIEPDLPQTTRRDIEAGCRVLVGELCARDGDEEDDVDYTRALLALAAKLRVHEVTGPLVAAAREFRRRPGLPLASKKRIVGTLLELEVRQDAAFWRDLLEQENTQLAGGAFAGLLRSDRDEALATLPRLPERQTLADAVTWTMELFTRDLSKIEREVFVPKLLAAWRQCQPVLRATLKEWLEEAGYDAGTATRQTAGVLVRLMAVLSGRNSEYSYSPQRAILPAAP